jgi:hypothetical protein
MSETATGLGIPTFKYIVSKIEDLATMLDTTVSISVSLADGIDDFKGFVLSIPLKNGCANIEIGRTLSKIIYQSSEPSSPVESKFQHAGDIHPDDVNRNFDIAFREIISADKRNRQLAEALQ